MNCEVTSLVFKRKRVLNLGKQDKIQAPKGLKIRNKLKQMPQVCFKVFQFPRGGWHTKSLPLQVYEETVYCFCQQCEFIWDPRALR